MNLKQLFLAVLCFLSINVMAQDVHYSYYQFAPSTINPSLTGAYYGNIRATVLRRSQWFNVGPSANDGYNTLNLLLDGNIPFGFKEGDWVSAGINLISEKSALASATAGSIDFNRGFNGLSVAYHMTMGKKNPSVLTFSGKYGTYSTSWKGTNQSLSQFEVDNGLPASNIDFDESLLQKGIDTDGNVSDEATDIQIGLMYTTPVGKKSDLRMGISADHLFNPILKTDTTSSSTGPIQFNERLGRRFNVFVHYYTDLNSKLTFNPTILYQTIGSASNLLLQGLFSYHHNKSKELYLNFGLGVRVASNMDIPIYLGADFKDWRIGLSFDLNVSGLSASTSNAGAYELGISKIFKWNKKAIAKPKLICPRL